MKHTPVSDYTHSVKPLSPRSERPTSSDTPHTTTLLTVADEKPSQTQREVSRRHAALAELTLDGVAAPEGCVEAIHGGVGHSSVIGTAPLPVSG